MFNKRHFLAGLAAAASMAARTAWAGAPLEVPIFPTRQGLPAIDVMIKGKGPFRFIVASGSSIYGIRPDLAQELGLKDKANLYEKLFGLSEGLAGDSTYGKYACDSLTIGGVQLPPLTLEGDQSKQSTDGVLGTGLFTWCSVEIDFKAGVARFYPDNAPDLSDFTAIPSYRKPSYPGDPYPPFVIAPIAFDDVEVDCMINTGSAADIYLSSMFVKKHGLWNRYPDFETHKVGSGGMVALSRRGQLDKMTLGPLTFDNVTLYLGDPDHDDNIGDVMGGAGGAIGMSLLKRGNLFIPRGKGLYLKPLPA